MKEQRLKQLLDEAPIPLIKILISHLQKQDDEGLKELIPYLLLLL